MDPKIKSQKRTARLAGLFYLAIAITGVYGIMYVPSQIIVSGDPTATSTNIINNEFLYRTGIFSNLVCQTVFVFLALTLYQLFKDVSERLSKLLVALVVVSVPIAFLIIFNQLFALLALKENFMKVFEPQQQYSLAMAFLKMYDNGNNVIGIFWGLWLIPFGQLVHRSGFIPKILGVILILGGLSYVLDASAFVLYPPLRSVTNILVGIFSSTAEFAMVLWLLVMGVKGKGVDRAVH